MRSFFTSLGFGLLLVGDLVFLGSLEAEPALELGEESLAFIAESAPSKFGTDRRGNLWTWNRKSSSVEVFDSRGVRGSQFELPGIRSLDVDASWGVVAISTGGSELVLISDEQPTRTIPLESNAGHVTWIDETTVALSTTLTAARIEIWDVRRELLLRSFGPGEEIVPRVGAVLLRSLALRYSPSADTLFALDSVNGTLEAWTLDGQLVRKDVFPSGRTAQIEQWLAGVDRQARAEHQKSTPFFEILRLSVDTDGTAWVVKSCSPGRDRATLLQVSEGSSTTRELDLPNPCCSNNFAIWNDRFISVLTARSESPGCVVWKELTNTSAISERTGGLDDARTEQSVRDSVPASRSLSHHAR